MKLLFLASSRPLTQADVQSIEQFLIHQNLPTLGQPVWIRPGKAAKLVTGASPSLDQVKALRDFLARWEVDVLCIKDDQPAIKLLLADMDCTIVTFETLDEIGAAAGVGQQVARITERTMNGSLNFSESLMQRVALLKGLPESAIKKILDETQLSQGAPQFIGAFREAGAKAVLVSGGFTYFTSVIAPRCGFDAHHANTLHFVDGHLDGTVVPPILDREAKLTYLDKYARDLGINLSQTLTIGDGANDLLMLHAAGIGIGYRPKPVVEAATINVLKYASMGDLPLLLDPAF